MAGTTIQLSSMDQMNLTMLAAQPGFDIFCKLAESIIVGARDEIFQIEPDQHKRILAAQLEARAMAKFYTRLRKQIEMQTREHIDKVSAAAMQRQIEQLDPNSV